MVDPIFFDNYGPFSLEEIAKISGAQLHYPQEDNKQYSSILIEGVAPLESANASHIAYLHNAKYLPSFVSSKAAACFVESKYIEHAPAHMVLLVSENPYKAYALAASAFYPQDEVVESRASSAHIDATATLGNGCTIEHGVVIGANVIIGDKCRIGANTVIGKGVVLGDNCNIGPCSTIGYALIGNNVIIHPGVRIGQDGFGFASDRAGHYKVPQLGRVIIGNNVEIGANTCIDRGSGHDTVIGEFCMIDNLVQIGHNVQLGKGCVLVAQVGIAGSTKFGDFVVAGGQVGVAGHLTVGSGAQIAAQSGVIKDISSGEIQGGYPAVPIKQWHRMTAILKKMAKIGREKHDT